MQQSKTENRDQVLFSYIEQIFQKYDTDGNGSLDSREMTFFFNDLFKSLEVAVTVTEEQAIEAIKTMDANYDGQVDKQELFATFKLLLGWSDRQPQMNQGNYGYQQTTQQSNSQKYPQNGYPQNGYLQNGYPQNGYPQNSYPQNSYPQNSYLQNNYPQNSYPQNSYPQNSYPQNGLPEVAPSFSSAIHSPYILNTMYSNNGINPAGYTGYYNHYQNMGPPEYKK